jgi:hypothetical protein
MLDFGVTGLGDLDLGFSEVVAVVADGFLNGYLLY